MTPTRPAGNSKVEEPLSSRRALVVMFVAIGVLMVRSRQGPKLLGWATLLLGAAS